MWQGKTVGNPPSSQVRDLITCRNIGHSEASSSISTIIKVILAIENRMIPKTTGIKNLNTKGIVPRNPPPTNTATDSFISVRWNDWHLKAVTEPTVFPSFACRRRAGVNAFGYGGTNSHAIIENLQDEDRLTRKYTSVRTAKLTNGVTTRSERPQVLVFSAHDSVTLSKMIQAYASMSYVPRLIDLAYTLAQRRSVFASRAFAICHQESLTVDIVDAVSTIKNESSEAISIAFAFTGNHTIR